MYMSAVKLMESIGMGRSAYDERIANGIKRDGNVLLGYDEDLTAAERCVYDFAHVVGGEGFALTKAEIKKHYVVVHVTQCRSGVAWEAVIARAHVLAAEVKRVKSEVHTTTPGLKAAEARARARAPGTGLHAGRRRRARPVHGDGRMPAPPHPSLPTFPPSPQGLGGWTQFWVGSMSADDLHL